MFEIVINARGAFYDLQILVIWGKNIVSVAHQKKKKKTVSNAFVFVLFFFTYYKSIHYLLVQNQ